MATPQKIQMINDTFKKRKATILAVILVAGLLVLAVCYDGSFGRAAECKAARALTSKSRDAGVAVQACRKAAEDGDLQAQVFVAEAYHQGGALYSGIEKDMKQARLWFERAEANLRARAEKGDGAAQYMLAVFYHRSLLRNEALSQEWAAKAAAQGYRAAEILQPQEEQVTWYTAATPEILSAANGGDAAAQYALCNEYPRALTAGQAQKLISALKEARKWCQTFIKTAPPFDPATAFDATSPGIPPLGLDAHEMAPRSVGDLDQMIEAAEQKTEADKNLPPRPSAKPDIDLGEIEHLCPVGYDSDVAGCFL